MCACTGTRELEGFIPTDSVDVRVCVCVHGQLANWRGLFLRIVFDVRVCVCVHGHSRIGGVYSYG